jgi:hypothetical protein
VLGRRAARYGPENEDLVQSILEDLLRPSGTAVESSDVPASAQLEQEPEETQRALIVAVRQLCVRLQREVPTAHQVRYLCGTKNSDHRTLREPVEKLLSTAGVALSQMLKRIIPERPPSKTLLCCCILIESLNQLSSFVLGLDLRDENLDVNIMVHGHLDDFWLTRCRRRRICPHRIERFLLFDTPVSQTYVATSLATSDPGHHNSCEFGAYCKAKPPPPSLPKHVDLCSGDCQNITVSADDQLRLQRKIEQQGYGVLRFATVSIDDPRFTVDVDHENAPYVAFSHVW